MEKMAQIENFNEITFNEFVLLVKQMRHNQRRYFAQRRPDILETCKSLEKQVDSIIAKMTDTQTTMF